MESKPWKGYVSSRNLGGHFVPQRVQNLVIRSHVAKLGGVYHLSATEYCMDECFMMLGALLSELESTPSVLVFYSTHMLPLQNQRRTAIYERVLAGGSELHFALEEIAIRGRTDVEMLEDIMMVRALAKPCAIDYRDADCLR